MAKQPLSSTEMRLLLRNLCDKGRSEGLEKGCRCEGLVEGWGWEGRYEHQDTHRFLRGRAGKELALISTRLLLLRSSISRATKGTSCSAETLLILLFALKTQTTVASINEKKYGVFGQAAPKQFRLSPVHKHPPPPPPPSLSIRPPTLCLKKRSLGIFFGGRRWGLVSQVYSRNFNNLLVLATPSGPEEPFGFIDVLFCL